MTQAESDAITFVRQIAEVKNAEHLARYFILSKAKELVRRMDMPVLGKDFHDNELPSNKLLD